MIEIIWKDETLRFYDAMMYTAGLLAWLTSKLAQEDELHDIDMSGYMVVKDKVTKKVSGLIFTGRPESQKKLVAILQQPPNEYKEKYIARVPCEEPEFVHEQAKEEDLEDKDKIEDKT